MSNALAHEKSPYLLQHADNPVNWLPWGEKAFAQARAGQKPIFLSIGYSTCHWCHVMAHESFESDAIAKILNEHFVSIKVDREERPDVDKVYMAYVQAMSGRGGWPLSAWLTPELKPFYGGTYFPPEDRHGRAGFPAILHAIARGWRDERDKLIAEGERVIASLREYYSGAGSQEPGARSQESEDGERRAENGPLSSGLARSSDLVEAAGTAFEKGFEYFFEAFDATHGGFGGAPKFPRASNLNFLFRVAALQGAESEMGVEAVRLAAATLRAMARGGIHDHVGGGFHRYSVDGGWFVPHFEKMLYDQAQIAVNCLEARQATGDERFAWLARDIFDYVARELTSPSGGFYTAEDADSAELAEGKEPGARSQESGGGENPSSVLGPPSSAKVEGAFYVWTAAELKEALGAEYPFFASHYGVEEKGNVASQLDPQGELRGKNILAQRRTLAETAQQFSLSPEQANDTLQAILVRLRERRARRPRPHLDDKVLTANNGLMISALARAHHVLGASEHSLTSLRENVAHSMEGRPPRRPTKCFPTPLAARAEASRPSKELVFTQSVTLVATTEGSQELERSDYLGGALRAAEFIHRELHDPARGVLFRAWREGRGATEGFAEDYAFLIQGLLDLYEASFDVRWLQWADRLQQTMDELFWDEARGGYFNSAGNDPNIVLRLKEDYDGAEPAPSSVAAMNLLRLGGMWHDESLRDRGRRTIEAFQAQWSRAPHAMPQLLCAIELALEPPRHVVIAGDPKAADFRTLAAVVHERLGPRRIILAAEGGDAQAWLVARAPWLAEMKPLDGAATAYVCEEFACRAPVSRADDLRMLLK